MVTVEHRAPMVVRAATSADFPTCLALNETFERFLSPLTLLRLGELHRQAALHAVVEYETRVIAFLLGFRENTLYDSVNYQWFERRHARFLYVDRVVVDGAVEARGAGTLLYEHVFELARSAGVPSVACEIDVDPPNPVSQRFHAKFHFLEVGRQMVAGGRKMVSLQMATTEPPFKPDKP